ncbi:MAG: tRNA uracil 4-sulfurtransferase ThiI, partial [bacterium]
MIPNQEPADSGPEMILVRYGELALKGKNRSFFEHALVRNLRSAAAYTSPVRIELSRGRIAVFPERRVMEVARRLQDVFGVKTISPAWGCEPDADPIASLAQRVMTRTLDEWPTSGDISFRVRTKRSDKSFPMTSTELDLYIAEGVLTNTDRLRVQLKGAQLELGIEVREKRAYVFTKRLPGPGGLPGGTAGRMMCLLSGGIDSPVAAWLAMKRGARVFFVTYHSHPYIGDASKKKVIDLVRRLSRFQVRCRLFIVPFTEIQTSIRDLAPEAYRTVLYRRFMQRLASRLAYREKCRALLTGESLGQVASQTIENMTC